jgi:hypothetical protein
VALIRLHIEQNINNAYAPPVSVNALIERPYFIWSRAKALLKILERFARSAVFRISLEQKNRSADETVNHQLVAGTIGDTVIESRLLS